MNELNNLNAISKDVLLEKYCKNGETTEDEIFKRVAKGIASVESDPAKQVIWEETFYNNMKKGAVGAGRIMAAAGTDIKVTYINCFVQGVGDCMEGYDEDGIPGIYEALAQSSYTLRRGGGVGYNFSKLRPKDSIVKGVAGLASGPCSYMDIFDTNCKTIESAGSRRGAQLSSLNIDHPDIFEFIKAKRTPGRWNNFNVSVMVTNKFMEAKNNNKPWNLVHKAEPSQKQKNEGSYYDKENKVWVYKTISAQELWNTIMQSTYDYAEPGILFFDNINNDNNLRYTELIETTNPCGEEPLPPYGCCDLGPIILTKFVNKPFTLESEFNLTDLKNAVSIQTRFLDNVLDATLWPLPQQYEESKNKRRIGIGITGLSNTLAMLGFKYNSLEARKTAKLIAETIRNAAYTASIELAREKGPFPLFNANMYLEEGSFASRLPDNIKDEIKKYGIRNSHLLSWAPVGTISLAFADNASNGIEPPFSLAYTRKKREADGSTKNYHVIDYGFKLWLSTLNSNISKPLLEAVCRNQKTFIYKSTLTLTDITENVNDYIKNNSPLVTALEITAEDHLLMMKVVQPYIDSAISKTINIPVEYPFEDFKNIYDKAYEYKLKGVATYRPNSIIGSILSVNTDTKKEEHIKPKVKETINIDPMSKVFSKRPSGNLAAISKKVTYSGYNGDNSIYIVVSFVNIKNIHRPIEIFITASPDSIPADWLASHSRKLSLLARNGLLLLAKALQDDTNIKSDRGQIRYGTLVKGNGNKVPKFHGSEVACISFAIQEMLMELHLLDDGGNPLKLTEDFKDLVTELVPINNPIYPGDVSIGSITNNIGTQIIAGKKCSVCGAHAVIKKDGCEFCTSCGEIGSCG